MFVRVEPEPSPQEREAILAALAIAPEDEAGWAAAALREGVEQEPEEP